MVLRRPRSKYLTAVLFLKVKNMFNDLLDSKEAKWTECKGAVVGRLTEMSEYFTGEKALTLTASKASHDETQLL